MDVVRLAKPRQVRAEVGAFRLPPADADVDMVALGEHPAVAAGNGAELEHRAPAVAVLARLRVGNVAFERNAVAVPVLEQERARRDSVDAVRADYDVRRQRLVADPDDAIVADGRDPGTVAELRAGVGSLLRKEGVEPLSLGHQDDRRGASALEAVAIPERELEAVDDVLHHRRDVDGKLTDRAIRQAASARLVAREPRAVEEEDRGSLARKAQGGHRAGGPAPTTIAS